MDSKCLFESSAKFYCGDGYHFNSAGITHFSVALADFVNKNFRSLNVFQKVKQILMVHLVFFLIT